MKIHLIPFAGLGNRLRVISSVYKYSLENSCELTIHWNKEKGLNAGFYDLFKPNEKLNISDSVISDFFIYNYPSKYNMCIPKFFDKILGRKSFYSIGINAIDEIAKNNKEAIVSTYSQQGELYPLAELFVPQDDIQQTISEIKSKFGTYTIGCHIRRTDNKQAKESSKLDIFFERFDSLFSTNPTAKIFLCTDDQEVKESIIAKYGNERIITYNSTLSRNSKKGIKDAVVELYSLASTDVIWGSYYSSYTDMASAIYGKQLEIIK